ncbi:methyl-accepting chemotaxis protein [Desulfobaculum xiamenense]|uniref:Methyl-accepting chemotaxis protein n=1 Tax=Desulfobaculum xiamenense TaxID=995050 RepID=A0A846QR64_9BACT|nr:methyl-accepting chemotaxis protein [Desulfobaculum xiamenense]NJB67149.1 methyl-accepting chemotaxis protein [Desulfobaculum xiamenense]
MASLRDMKLRTKLLATLLGCSLVPLIVLGLLSAEVAKTALVHKSFDELDAIAQIKRNQIETYFARRGDDVSSLAMSRDAAQLFSILNTYREDTNTQPDGNYDVKSGEYQRIWQENSGFFTKYMQVYQYYDIFVISADHGHVMFTAARETDLGENLSAGKLKDSGLASVWRKVIETDSTRYEDFEPYAPSGGAPAAFVAAPIHVQGKTVAVLAVQLSIDAINFIMQERTGLGKSGEIYLVGPDKRMRSDSFLQPDTHSVKASFAGSVEKNGVDTVAVKEALEGKTDHNIITDYTGNSVLSSYGPINFSRERWAMVAEIDEHEIMEPVRSLQMTITIIAIIAAILIGGIAIFFAGSITSPVIAIQAFANKVAQGDLHSKLTGEFGGELRMLAEDIKKMVAELKNKLGFAQGVLNGITLPCSVVSADDKLIFINRQKLDVLGKKGKPKDFEGISSGKFFYNDAGRETLAVRSLKEGKQLTAEVPIKSETGKDYLINSTCTPINDLDGKLIGSLVIWFDLTDIRAQEQRIREQHDRIAKAADKANVVSEQVTSSAEQLAAQIEQSSRGTEVQRQRTTETATAIEEMNATIMEVAKNAGTASDSAKGAKERAMAGGELMQKVIASINMVQKKSLELKESMADLGTHAEGISQVMTVITDIADQTNLLALNAAIEAARAGDAGRGFAVVADEVRKLAEKTMNATQEVGNAISTIQTGTRTSIQEMDEAANLVEKSTELVNDAGTALQAIVKLVESTAAEVQNIATAAEEQSAASEQITRAADEINTIASETADAMNQSAEAVSNLTGLAQELKTIIEDMQED